MFPAFGLSVYERDKMADYSSAWRVVTRIVTDYFFYHEDISFVTRRITDDLFVPNYRIIEFFFTRRIADCHGESFYPEFANYSSHGELRMVTEDFFVTNLRIVLHTDGHGESRRISLA